jgi:hypothetical protein
VSQALQSLKCCLNPKVLIALAAAAVAVVVLAPNLIAGAFPLLLALVCPLSMLVMMGGMARMGTNKENAQTGAPTVLTSVDAPVPPGLAVSPDARLALLRAQQQVLAEQNAAIAAEIAAPDATETGARPPSRALQQAEQVAVLADSRAAREHA